jgi:hypothetical protein
MAKYLYVQDGNLNKPPALWSLLGMYETTYVIIFILLLYVLYVCIALQYGLIWT